MNNRSPFFSWLTAHPFQALGRGFRILFNALFGAFGVGVLIVGPLNGSVNATLVFGTLATAVLGHLWFRQQHAAATGDRAMARRRYIPLALIPALGVSIALVAGGTQLYGMGYFAPVTDDPVAGFDRLWETMERHYPYFELKGVDWQEVYTRYRPQVEAAEDDRAYFAAIHAMFNELQDGHSYLITPNVYGEDRYFFGFAAEMDGEAVMTQINAAGEAGGLREGDVLLEVNGRPVAEVAEAWLPRISQGATPWFRQRKAYMHLLATYDESMTVTIENAEGEVQTLELVRPSDPAAAYPRSGQESALVTAKRLPSGIGVIRIHGLYDSNGEQLVPAFDAALDEMFDAPAIIVDVRNNGGGDSRLGDRIAGRFVDERFTYGRETYRTRIPTHLWRSWTDYRVTPRGRTYTGPVAILINEGTDSSAEQFAVAMVDSGRAIAVGRTTGGGSGNPIRVKLPHGGEVKFSTGDFRRNDGRPIEGEGIAPELPVTWTGADYRAGRDPDVEAAETYLLEK